MAVYKTGLKRLLFWTEFKTAIAKKHIMYMLQYEETEKEYSLFVYDGPAVYSCFIYKNNVPVAILPNYSQEQNDLDKADFENNYKGYANQAVPEVHNLIGILTTNTTVSDQVIIEYAVPINRAAYVVGWRFSSSGAAVDAAPFKIGCNDISAEPMAPGEKDGNLFRTIYTMRETTIAEDYSSCPRLLAESEDIIKVAITPSNNTIVTWRACLDIILR